MTLVTERPENRIADTVLTFGEESRVRRCARIARSCSTALEWDLGRLKLVRDTNRELMPSV